MSSEIQIKVRGYHIDHFGHVNNGKYYGLFEEGRWNYFDDKPELIDYFHTNDLMHVVAGILIRYKRPLVVGDLLTLETEVLKARKSGFTMLQAIYKNDTDIIAATAEVQNVLMNGASGKIVPVPSELAGLWPDLGI
ncbi:acyl-CoA thioesterase [Thermodesulfobacteriota bacterium]